AALEALRREADAAQACEARIAAALEKLAAEPQAEVPLIAGGSAAGKVLSHDAGALRIAEPGTPLEAGEEVALADLAPAFARKLAQGAVDGKEDHLGPAHVFLRRGALQAAVEELQALEAEGGLTAELREDLDGARARLDDALARAVARRGAALARMGKLAEALPLLARVIPGGDLGATPSARGSAKPIGEDWVRARAAQLAAGPVTAFFNGRATLGKKKVLDLTYSFTDPAELEDWVPQKKDETFAGSAVRKVGSAAEFTGRVCWRGALKGEFGFEAAVASGGQNVSANFVFCDRGHPWDGWLVGIGATIPDITIFQLSKNAPQRSSAAFEFPSHLIARMKGSLAQTEFLFGARGPIAPSSGGFRVGVGVKKRIMTVTYLGGKILAQVPVLDEKDLSGGIAVQPWGHRLVVEEIHIQGEVDEAWVKTEAAARAEAELAAAGAGKKP
ncbi:MAG TPA: hypothetical protein VHF22_00605, partial [Planctomycetota bacterium]|nr:hypothetical protein [Planctomycetota bacterium]